MFFQLPKTVTFQGKLSFSDYSTIFLTRFFWFGFPWGDGIFVFFFLNKYDLTIMHVFLGYLAHISDSSIIRKQMELLFWYLAILTE